MIHYTLLPEKQIRSLKKEYRTRLVIFLFFFLSCSALLGSISLIPSYIFTYLQEKELLVKESALNKNSKTIDETGNLVKDFSKTNEIVKKLKDHKKSIIFSGLIQDIISHKPQGLSLRSFNVYVDDTSTSTIIAIIQGKSPSRETLIQFKNKIEADPLVSKVELPVSDLVKSKDVSYSIKISFIKTI